MKFIWKVKKGVKIKMGILKTSLKNTLDYSLAMIVFFLFLGAVIGVVKLITLIDSFILQSILAFLFLISIIFFHELYYNYNKKKEGGEDENGI